MHSGSESNAAGTTRDENDLESHAFFDLGCYDHDQVRISDRFAYWSFVFKQDRSVTRTQTEHAS